MPRADPTYQPITEADSFFAGEDSQVQWTISSNSGAVQDLTGFSLEFRMAATRGGASVLTKAVTIVSAPAGTCLGTFVAADTASLTPGNYWYTMRRTNPGANQVLAHGPVALQAGPV